jgi:hypothetical protein
MEVFKRKYWNISFEEKNAIIIPRYFAESQNLNDDLYKAEMEIYTQMVEKYRPKSALIDCMLLGYAIPPAIQEWTNTTLFPRLLKVGVTKVAILLPVEIVAMLSLEQVMDESMGKKFTTKYFSDEVNAREWLNS